MRDARVVHAAALRAHELHAVRANRTQAAVERVGAHLEDAHVLAVGGPPAVARLTGHAAREAAGGYAPAPRLVVDDLAHLARGGVGPRAEPAAHDLLARSLVVHDLHHRSGRGRRTRGLVGESTRRD